MFYCVDSRKTRRPGLMPPLFIVLTPGQLDDLNLIQAFESLRISVVIGELSPLPVLMVLFGIHEVLRSVCML